MKPYRILVTGSRAWTDAPAVRRALNEAVAGLDPLSRPAVIVHGDCRRGADAHADKWGQGMADNPLFVVSVERYPANWRPGGEFDRRAGFRRNAEMVAAGADICLAFIKDGSRGASHTAALAEQAGIPVRRFEVST